MDRSSELIKVAVCSSLATLVLVFGGKAVVQAIFGSGTKPEVVQANAMQQAISVEILKTGLRKANPKGVPVPLAKYVNVVEAGNTLYISGQIGADESGKLALSAAEQLQYCFNNIRLVLEDADMDFDNVAKVTVFLTDLSQLAHYRVARDQAMGVTMCASSLVVVKSLATPQMLVEIEAVAVRRSHL
jgi:enamine deaminase RidA (YjgF/YER057c/UK114 family)